MRYATKCKQRIAVLVAVVMGHQVPLSIAQESDDGALEEIIVSASKRDKTLQETTTSISVIGAEDLLESRYMDMNDFLPSLPSVSFIDFGGGRNTIIIRGLTAQPQLEDKVVSTYFGEANVTQLGSVSGGANGTANLKMIDIERIELLRGPQGTLWGAGSMGGTLRILPKEPNLEQVEGEVGVGFSKTVEYGDDNSIAHAVLNFPVSDGRFGVRLVGYHGKDSGYVRNVAASDPMKVAAAEATGAIVINEDGIGDTEFDGFRASALWQVSDSFRASFLFAYQDMFIDGRSEVNLNLGPYEQARWEIPGAGSEYIRDEFKLYNLVFEWDLGPVSLVSSTSNVRQVSHTDRNFLGDFFEFNPTAVINDTDNDVVVQELRLVARASDRLEYVVGYYYENLEQNVDDVTAWLGSVESNIFDPAGSNELGSFDDFEEITQNAFFGELTYKFSDRFSATLGARYFDYDKFFVETFPVMGVFNIGLPEPDIRNADEPGQTFKVAFDYQFNDEVMMYAQWAEGFRLGDYVQPWPETCDADDDGLHDELGLPRTTEIGSDETDNYEVGLRWFGSGGRFSVNSSVFLTDWVGLPVSLGADSTCGFGVVINGGKARTQGIEFEGSIQATDSARIDYGLSFLNAELKTDVDAVGSAGDRLPGSPEFSAWLGATYDFVIVDRPSYLRLDYTYVGGYYGNVGEIGPEAGDYHLIDVNASVDLQNDLTLSAYIKNLTNSDALTWVDFFPPNAMQLRPRVVGVDIRYRF